MSRTTKILVAVVVVLAGIYVIQRLTTRTSTTQESKPFAGIDTSMIDRIQVDFGKDIVIEKQGGAWTITSPVSFPADPGQIGLLLTRIAANPSASVVADNLSDSSAYGLGRDAGSAAIRTSDGKNLAMKIGSVTPDFNGCYFQLIGQQKVYQLATNIRSLVSASLTDWRDRRIFRFGADDIESVDLALGDTLYHFTHHDTAWQVNGTNIPEIKAQDIVGGLIGTTALGFIDSSMTPSKVLIDYGITLTDRRHIAGQVFKSAGSEVSFGNLCISNSANGQIYTISSTVPEELLQGLRELQKIYLTKESS